MQLELNSEMPKKSTIDLIFYCYDLSTEHYSQLSLIQTRKKQWNLVFEVLEIRPNGKWAALTTQQSN